MDAFFWRSCATLVLLGLIAVVTGRSGVLPIGWLSGALNFYCALAYAATAALLLGSRRVDARRSIVILAAASAGTAALAAVATVTQPMSAVLPAVIPAASVQAAPWLYVLEYLFATGGALVYALVRRRDAASPPTRRTVIAIVAGTAGVSLAVAVAAIFLAGRFPLPAAGPGWRTGGPGFALALVTAGAFWRLRSRDGIDRAVLLSVIALAVIDVVAAFNGRLFTLGFALVRVLAATSATFVLVAALRRMMRAYENLPIMQAKLDRSERHAVRQSDRLAAVWRLVHEADLSEEQRVQAILDTGAAAIRPERAFYGTLARVDFEDLVVEYVSEAFKTGPENGRRLGRNDRARTETSFGADVIAAAKTIAFSDYDREAGPLLREKRYDSGNWNSIIGTTFEVANTRYVLSFAAVDTLHDEPFTDDDLAFVDVLASFLTSRLYHARQLAQIRFQIEHDLLTGLPTRASFRISAAQVISAGVPCAIAVIDLDCFREVNETFGHMLGDAMLVEIAAGLTGARRGHEIVARLAGDNFGVLLDNVSTAVDVEARLAPYRKVFERPLVTGDRTGREALYVGASTGVALFPHDAATFADLLAAADAAVDVAKARQRGSIAFCDPASEATMDRRRTMRLDLAAAIDKDELELHYQPTVELGGGAVVGMEALVRWEHPVLGAVAPNEFIPIAEHNTLIRPIGSWVVDRAIADVEALGPLPEPFRCFINISGLQLRLPEFVAAMRRYLTEKPDVTSHIGVDINEAVAMQDPDRYLDVMAVLRELGLEIALDDFGTGHSALTYVTRFPINVIKIDRRFIARLPGTEYDAAIVEVLLGIAQRFGFRTHAEGIETPEQYEWLRQRGCVYGSGFHIAPPMRFGELQRYLQAGRLAGTDDVFAIQPPR